MQARSAAGLLAGNNHTDTSLIGQLRATVLRRQTPHLASSITAVFCEEKNIFFTFIGIYTGTA
jgi:phosphotransacetylase